MDPGEPRDVAPRAKRKRGPYKQYLDVSKGLEVPRSTVFSRKKAIGSFALFIVVFTGLRLSDLNFVTVI